MHDAVTLHLRPDVAEFVKAQAEAEDRSVAEFVEGLVLREKERHDARGSEPVVLADPELLRQKRHGLVRDDDETDDEYAARAVLFEALLGHARRR